MEDKFVLDLEFMIENTKADKDLSNVIKALTAKDFDDAVCLVNENGVRTLWVAIADVAHYVREGGPLDQEAYLRGTSVYFPDRVVPMLPEALSNGLCSINPEVDRLCMVCEMYIDQQGKI